VELCLSIRKGGVELSFVFGKVIKLLHLIFLVRLYLFNIIVSSLLLYHASVSVTTHFTIVVLLVALV
jgi:hypothetical protein